MAVLYVSGAGSDVITIKLKENSDQITNMVVPTVQVQIDTKQRISVEDYFRFRT